ncbi:MAG: ABC transporter substrate-binding protein [Candidatus Thorarchaeota archaeon]
MSIAIILVATFSPTAVTAQSTILGNPQTGPFIDRLVYNIIEDPDQQALALQNGSIDFIGDIVDPKYFSTLTATEDIEVVKTPRNGYGYITINTAKYPFNITAFRRALAFALDKVRISEEVWDGLAEPLDSVVPKSNPFSAEDLLTYHYYEADITKGKQLLTAAGFIDSDSDGYLEGPGHGGSGTVDLETILVEYWNSGTNANVSAIITEALRNLGFDAIALSLDLIDMIYNVNYHKDYDIVFLGRNFRNFDVDWLAYEYSSESASEPYHNFPNFCNSDYDAWKDIILYSTDYDEIYHAAIEMQNILVYQCPVIVCYENVLLTAHRTDRFEGFLHDVANPIPYWWTNQKAHLRADRGGPFGGTFRWSISKDIDTFNFMIYEANSAPYGDYARGVLGELYDSLLVWDWQGNIINWLAESYLVETHADNPSVLDGHIRYTFRVLQNASWSDNTPLTAEDVAFSINYYKQGDVNPNHRDNPYSYSLTNLVSATTPTAYVVVAEFNDTSYWNFHTLGRLPIIPKHVFESIGPENWDTWDPQPPNKPMVTSGPYNVTEHIAGEFIELTHNSIYFYGPVRSNGTNQSTMQQPKEIPWIDSPLNVFIAVSLVVDAVVAGSLIVDYTANIRKRRNATENKGAKIDE